MLGYRLIHRDELDRKNREIDQLRVELTALQEKRVELLERLGSQRAEAKSKATMADLLITRNNVLERTVAAKAHRDTGVPQVVAEIAKGSPTMNAALGVGADLFSDVGDDEADRLEKLGLLHNGHDDEAFPSAAALAPADVN